MLSYCFLWQDVAPTATGAPLTIPFLLIGIAIFYFFMIRPSLKEQRAQKDFAESIKKGARIVTAGGIHGVVASVEGDIINVAIAPKTNIKVQRGYISSELTNAAYGKNASSAPGSSKE